MLIKNIKLKKGMSKNEVNELIHEYLELEDDIYLGVDYKHNWKCKCGNIFIAKWDKIRHYKNIDCGCSEYNKSESMYENYIDKHRGYKYIRSFRNGDTLPNGKITKKVYVEIHHEYCNKSYVTRFDGFKKGKRCPNCCQEYENSFAHHIEEELGEPLEKYWDFEKNTVNPYLINKYSREKIWIKCTNESINKMNGLMKKDYHKSYEILPSNFIQGRRCSYCGNHKTHIYDSFGYNNPKMLDLWSDKNNINPFEIAAKSNKRYIFICYKCGKEFKATASDVMGSCKICNSSLGEFKVNTYLKKLDIEFKQDICYFNDLRGINGGLLRPDFILPQYKVWIEYDGEFHYKNKVNKQTQEEYEFQNKNDKIKDRYAKEHGWKLIRIPYWEINNIESILNKELI